MDWQDEFGIVCPPPMKRAKVAASASATHSKAQASKQKRATPQVSGKSKKPSVPVRVRLGTMFSGLETPSIAFKLRLGGSQLVYAIEKEKPLRDLIQLLWNPKQLHGDVLDVDFTALPTSDVLVGGPPCPSFSPAGNLQGRADGRCSRELLFSAS